MTEIFITTTTITTTTTATTTTTTRAPKHKITQRENPSKDNCGRGESDHYIFTGGSSITPAGLYSQSLHRHIQTFNQDLTSSIGRRPSEPKQPPSQPLKITLTTPKKLKNPDLCALRGTSLTSGHTEGTLVSEGGLGETRDVLSHTKHEGGKDTMTQAVSTEPPTGLGGAVGVGQGWMGVPPAPPCPAPPRPTPPRPVLT
ncbi:hypothetical protein E2C01_015473 [Portunus trituberculatus]|uniref:Uncharacterized protein n=1 Tax=Portunus trituberculatus TaxID=210409 RepID=A0A5B7DLY7_PORTR|nr:hypothetical protein [Portunus trituberculatus]